MTTEAVEARLEREPATPARLPLWAVALSPLVGLSVLFLVDVAFMQYPDYILAYPWLDTVHNVLRFIFGMFAWPGCAVFGISLGLALVRKPLRSLRQDLFGVTAIALGMAVVGSWIVYTLLWFPTVRRFVAGL